MKADIQSEIAWNDAKISFIKNFGQETYGYPETIPELRRRNAFLNRALKFKYLEIDKEVRTFIYK